MPHLKPDTTNQADSTAEPDFYFIERDNPADVVEAIRRLLAERIPARFGLDPIRDVQVLTPMRKGELGVEALNAEIKALLNPNADAEVAGLSGLSPGDRVMQTANNYDKSVFNGDVGRVLEVLPETRELVVRFDDRNVHYLADERDQVTPAYAMTIHKSQGSEYPAVIIPVHTQHWIMLQRNLIYTALTRARRLACLVGSKRALRRAVANATRARRFTALPFFLR